MSRRFSFGLLLLAFLVGSLASASPCRAQESDAVEQIVSVLREKGLIDEATGDEILAKQERSNAKQGSASPAPSGAAALTEGFIWSGDFRLRNEQFWYGKALGSPGADDANQFRYRARIGFTKQVNPWALVGLRLATGTGNYRSTNVSFGQTSNWAPQSIYVDRAYGQFTLPDPGDVGLKSTLLAGRIQNPFVWKSTFDKIVWDEDISPTGFALTSSYSPMEGTTIFGTAGYFVELTQSCCTDTKVFSFQLGGSTALVDKLVAGARASYYDWDNVSTDPNFDSGSESFGNLPTAFDDDAHIGETTVYVTWSGIEGWPLLVWGTLAYNFTAEAGTVDAVRVDPEDTAYGYGIEIGNAKNWFLIGIEYQHIEANAVISLYTDSDMFDGYTNREGFGIYVARELAANTELKLSFWDDEPIRTTASGEGNGPYNISPSADSQANRKRLQADVNFKF